MLNKLKKKFLRENNKIVEIQLPEYGFYILKNEKQIPTGHYARGVIIDEIGDSAYKVRLFIKGEPEKIFYFEHLKFL